jgi:hypothetical protein
MKQEMQAVRQYWERLTADYRVKQQCASLVTQDRNGSVNFILDEVLIATLTVARDSTHVFHIMPPEWSESSREFEIANTYLPAATSAALPDILKMLEQHIPTFKMMRAVVVERKKNA